MRLPGVVLAFAAVTVPLLAQQAVQSQEREFLSRIRRLTIEGKRAGEGYWSPDGQRIVFPLATRENPLAKL